MNTDSVLRDEQGSQPLVQWFPRGGPIRAVSPDVVAGVALGVVATAALAFAVLAATRRGGLFGR